MVEFEQLVHACIKAKSKYSGLDLIEKRMNELKDEDIDSITVPNRFWCTFRYGEARQTALKLKKIDFKKGDPKLKATIRIKAPESPSDINWLNRGLVSKNSQVCKGILIVIVILIAATLVQFMFGAGV